MSAAPHMPIIALSSMTTPEMIERGARGRLPRFRRQVRPPGSDRRAQGTDRRHSSRRHEDDMNEHERIRDASIEYVTVMIGEQLFGLPIARVQDVFMPDRLTPVPLAPPEIAGVLNLRGRIVTAIDMRRRLGHAGARRHGRSDGGRHRLQRRVLWPADRFGRRGDEACRRQPRAECRSISTPRLARVSRPACIGWKASCWWCSTSTACST